MQGYDEPVRQYAPQQPLQTRTIVQQPQFQQVYQPSVQYLEQEEIIVQYENTQFDQYGQPVQFAPVLDNRPLGRPRPQAQVMIQGPQQGQMRIQTPGRVIYQNSPQYKRVVTPVQGRMHQSPMHSRPMQSPMHQHPRYPQGRSQPVQRTPNGYYTNQDQEYDDQYEYRAHHKENMPVLSAAKKEPKRIQNPTPKAKKIVKKSEATPIVEEVEDDKSESKESLNVVQPVRRTAAQEVKISLRNRLGMVTRPIIAPTTQKQLGVSAALTTHANTENNPLVHKIDSPTLSDAAVGFQEVDVKSAPSTISKEPESSVNVQTQLEDKFLTESTSMLPKNSANETNDITTSTENEASLPKSILKKPNPETIIAIGNEVNIPVQNVTDLAAEVRRSQSHLQKDAQNETFSGHYEMDADNFEPEEYGVPSGEEFGLPPEDDASVDLVNEFQIADKKSYTKKPKAIRAKPKKIIKSTDLELQNEEVANSSESDAAPIAPPKVAYS